jgi:hypothetical protein
MARGSALSHPGPAQPQERPGANLVPSRVSDASGYPIGLMALGARALCRTFFAVAPDLKRHIDIPDRSPQSGRILLGQSIHIDRTRPGEFDHPASISRWMAQDHSRNFGHVTCGNLARCGHARMGGGSCLTLQWTRRPSSRTGDSAEMLLVAGGPQGDPTN